MSNTTSVQIISSPLLYPGEEESLREPDFNTQIKTKQRHQPKKAKKERKESPRKLDASKTKQKPSEGPEKSRLQ